MNRWILGARPKTLPAVITPVIVALALAYPSFDFVNALLALIVGLSLQVAVNYANDYSDGIRGTDTNRIGPTRLVASGLATAAEVKRAAYITFGIGAIAGSYLAARSNYWLMVIGATAIISAWRYTGGRNPYGYRGLGELYVFIYFGLVATIGTYFSQTGNIGIEAIVAGVANGSISCAILMVNNIRDIAGDTNSGKRTLAVRIGETRARRLFMFMIFVAIFSGFTISILVALGIFPAIRLLNEIKYKKGSELISVLSATGKFQLIIGTLISIGSLIGF